MKLISKLLLLFVSVFLLSVSTCPAAEEEKGAGEKPAKPPSLVEVAEIVKGEAEPMLEFVGSVSYARKSNVAAEVEGVVEKVFFEEGYRVKASEPLVSLEAGLPAEAHWELSRALSEMSEAYSAEEQAWIMRRGLDRAYAAIHRTLSHAS